MGRLVSLFTIVAAALSIAAAPPATADIDIRPVGSVPVPEGPAEAWIVADLDTGQVLAGRNDNTRYAPASTIKTLLAHVVLDEVPLDATIVADEADTRVECNCAGVAPGRVYTARQLLEGLLLASGNDAANTLARMLGGMDAAVAKMNAKAAALGAHGTNVVTPSGLDGPGMPFWSTPHDLAVIFRAALASPVFAQITAMPTAVFPAKTGDAVLVNQNELLRRYPGAIGGKTGFTDIARKTYVGAAQRDGRRLVVALMHGLVKEGGPTYWDQAAGLLDWGFALDRSANVGVL
ncbi:D-alanyl-D-alanine carboxypeptidase [Mycobacterium sp. PS03-16]|uniref:D-alanyl-D-alanine carboxypeptidase family protein n=1 Tax=Mycobacterium sp. PS03-16 TaxID=2559611 RepID=UPI00107322D2|nr:D-alanyl-D-alanine carboxypeptidase family protein [Mycobacterium sp. PS03-16]TFV55162.1 D-alanyl-D-alanine carboxypeptidase [Mycobacterium sp. PS03-16]